MARAPRPPRGYKEDDWPLFHHIPFEFTLRTYSSPTNLGTILPLFYHDNEVIASPTTTAVNPKHASFTESVEMGILSGSIIPKVSFNFSAQLTKLAIETDKIRTIHFSWMPIYIAFVENLTAFDERTGDLLEEVLDLVHDTTDEVTFPLWNATKLDDGFLMPTSTQGLTTTQVMEGVSFTNTIRQRFYKALKYYGNSAKLKASIGRVNHVNVTRDRPFIFSSGNFTNPKVKAGNPYMFCGVRIMTDETDQVTSRIKTGDVTNIAHLRFNGSIDFQEWNHMFLQDTE